MTFYFYYSQRRNGIDSIIYEKNVDGNNVLYSPFGSWIQHLKQEEIFV